MEALRKGSESGPRLNLACWKCGELARLKSIRALPFSKGVSEATYECAKCGTEIKRTLTRGY
jgi:C4-type Zn-finger protein